MNADEQKKLLELVACAQTRFWELLRDLELATGKDLESTQDFSNADLDTLEETR